VVAREVVAEGSAEDIEAEDDGKGGAEEQPGVAGEVDLGLADHTISPCTHIPQKG